MRAAAALSEHPLAAHAVGELAGSLLESLNGDPIDLLVMFVERSHTGAIEDAVNAMHELLAPKILIGATAGGVLARDVEVENRHSMVAWAASGINASPIRVEPGATSPEQGWGHPESENVILLADPFTCPIPELITDAAEQNPHLRLHGGFASAANAPGGNRLILGDDLYSDGAVGVHVSGVPIRSVVSQGCRPIGRPLTVTGIGAAERDWANVITELGSRPPLEVIRTLADTVADEDRELLSQGLHIGVVIDESAHEHETGDFLIRSVLGGDPNTGALAVGAEVDVGTTVQFHVRDASTATQDLNSVLAGEQAQAALMFTCNGRGERLFGRAGHDAELLHELTGANAIAGMFCAGELGPVAASNHIHGLTASTVLFG